jgi:large subunit ribosomal protein L19
MANFVTYNKSMIRIGDTVQVHYKLIEKEEVSGKAKKEKKEQIRERIQIFEGILIAIKGNGENRMITVRRIGTAAVGVERIFPVNSPWVKNITIKKSAKVRRAKLYYLRAKTGREADRLKEKAKLVVPQTVEPAPKPEEVKLKEETVSEDPAKSTQS